ncbi:hypothetical protein PAXINDRAFT_152563 [Paxillus involutus ATCC 200175]|nr:hypothetical protein PAXINDRAFT_152563 [Paxillus involutus ATCC 200175]
MPLSEEQELALQQLRAANWEVPLDASMSFGERACLPTTITPNGIVASTTIPIPTLDSTKLKKAEQVPIFFLRAQSTEGETPRATPHKDISWIFPENSFPVALQDLAAAYDYLISKGCKASNITISGDSADGNHALVLTYLISQSDRSLPTGIIIAPVAIQLIDASRELEESQGSEDAGGTSGVRRSSTWVVGIFPEENQDVAQRIARFILGS